MCYSGVVRDGAWAVCAGESRMTQYRLRFMDGLSGHVAVVRDFDVDSDDDALAEAESRRGTVAMELWCGDRKVRRWAPRPDLETTS